MGKFKMGDVIRFPNHRFVGVVGDHVPKCERDGEDLQYRGEVVPLCGLRHDDRSKWEYFEGQWTTFDPGRDGDYQIKGEEADRIFAEYAAWHLGGSN